LTTVQLQPDPPERAECPQCRNRDGIRDGGLSLRRHRAYDILSDSYGLHRCPRCGHRGHRSEFFKTTTTTK
jgi:predicted nucleic-acid-binding Zn-ribbon protein